MKKLLIFLLLAISLFSLVSAAQTTTNNIYPEGYTIEEISLQALPVDTDLNYYFFLRNSTNGKLVDNSSTDCYLYLADRSTNLLAYQKTNYNSLGYWNVEINKGNFSERSYYYYGVNCENDVGGGLEGILEVNTKGIYLNNGEIGIYFIVLFGLLFFWVLCIYGSFNIPMENIKNNDQEIIKVNWKKYLKIFCMSFAYVFFVMIVWFMWNLVYAYSDWYALSNIFHMVYRFMFAVGIPIVISIWIYAIAKLKDDKKINDFIGRMGIPFKPF